MSRWPHAVVVSLAISSVLAVSSVLVTTGCSSSAENAARGAVIPDEGDGPPSTHSPGSRRDGSMPEAVHAWSEGRQVMVLLRLPGGDGGFVRTEGLADAVVGVRLLDLQGRTVRTATASGRRGDLVFAEFSFEAVPSQIRVLLERGDDLGPVTVAAERPSAIRVADLPELVPLRSGGARSILALAEGAAGTYEVEHDGRHEVALPADVLFDTDRSDLSPTAGAVVAAAFDTLRMLEPGTVVVIAGNTDDVGDDAYNLDLSRRRADTVAAALGAARPVLPVVFRVEARGEGRPLVPNLDDAGTPIATNRGLNRRVSLEYSSAAISSAGNADLDGVVVLPDARPATGGVPVAGSVASASTTVTNALGSSAFRLDVVAAVRLEGALRISLTLQNVGGSNTTGDAWRTLFADGARSDGRIDVDDSLLEESQSLRSLRLVDGRLLARPFLDDEGRVIGSRGFRGPLPVGKVTPLVAWFPSPPAGVGGVDLMVPTFGTIRAIPLS